jgi:serralysin
MENVIGGELGDTLTGNTLANSLAGGPGNDRLNGGLGNDKLFGDAGNDTYLFQDYGVSESDEISDTSGAYDLIDFSQASLGINLNLGVTTVQTLNSRHQIRLHQDNGIEAAVGGRGNDTLRGNALNNRLLGGGGNDVLVGGAGNDVLIGGARNDRYFFDADTDLGADTIVEVADAVGGVDVLDFTTTTTVGVNVDLSKTSAQEIVAGKLTLTLGSPIAVEGVNGTSLADLIIGNSLNNLLIGGAGNDIINAGAGLDFVIGGLGADVISGGDDDDLLISGRTSYDSNLPQLFSLQKTWVSNLGYLTKVSRLRTGSGVAQLALGVTVFDDGESNSISGNTGRDWFFAQLAQISDLSLDEEVN